MNIEIKARTSDARVILPFRAAVNVYDNMACSPFFPGGEYMARWILDNQGVVAGKHVIDIGSGSGAVAIAAAIAGARHVDAWDEDPRAVSIIHENAAMNGVAVHAFERSLQTPEQLAGFDGLICAADIFYREDDRNEGILLQAAHEGGEMLVASYDSELAGFQGIARNVSALPGSSQPHVYVRMFHKP